MQGTLSARSHAFENRIVVGFIAGFAATLVFHQPVLYLLHMAGLTPGLPYSLKEVPPFGVPQCLSLAFWGGVWGILFESVEPRLPRRESGYWLAAIVFGAVFPTLVAWFVVLPLKGMPAAGGFHLPGLFVGPIVNAAWGLGTALFLNLRPAPAAGYARR